MFFPYVPTEASEPDTDQRVILNMAVACEDTGSALRAKALFEQIKRKLGPDFEIQSAFWTFAEMGIAELKARAEGDFAVADILVVSYRGDGIACGLPNCLADLLAQRSAHARALVTLDGSQRPTTSLAS